jgi:hypothetical protein
VWPREHVIRRLDWTKETKCCSSGLLENNPKGTSEAATSITDPKGSDWVVEHTGVRPRHLGDLWVHSQGYLSFLPREFWCCPPQSPQPVMDPVWPDAVWISVNVPAWCPCGAVSAGEEPKRYMDKADPICLERMTRQHHGQRTFEKGGAGLLLGQYPQNRGTEGTLHAPRGAMYNVPVVTLPSIL